MKTRLALASVFVALVMGCVESIRVTAGNPASEIKTEKTENNRVERMVRAVPLVFYNGSGGAGVLFKSGGKIGMMTAAHVISDSEEGKPQTTYGTKIIHITGYKPGTEDLEYTTTAKLVAISPEEDWALLHVAEEKSGMEFVDFATFLPRIGQSVWAVGSPLFDAGTISRGVVCHPSRKPAISPDSKMRFIHTDATGTGGSSGGGLFTDDGVCIGIVVRRNPMNDTMYSVPTYLIHESICAMFLPPEPMPIFVE